jgi:hypothetical protein
MTMRVKNKYKQNVQTEMSVAVSCTVASMPLVSA